MTEIRVVSERSEREIAKARAAQELASSIRVLAATLLRVIAGAGREHALYREIMDCAVHIQACASLEMAPREISLRIAHEEVDSYENASPEQLDHWSKDGTLEGEHARQKIVKGALRKVASDMMGHHTLARAGERMMLEGSRELEAAREKCRRFEDSNSTTPKQRRSTRKKIDPERRTTESDIIL